MTLRTIRFETSGEGWRMSEPETGEVRECGSLAVLLDQLYRDLAGTLATPLAVELVHRLEEYADRHAECDA